MKYLVKRYAITEFQWNKTGVSLYMDRNFCCCCLPFVKKKYTHTHGSNIKSEVYGCKVGLRSVKDLVYFLHVCKTKFSIVVFLFFHIYVSGLPGLL